VLGGGLKTTALGGSIILHQGIALIEGGQYNKSENR